MANNIMMLRCRWCGDYVPLGKGYYGDLRGLVNADLVNTFIEAHGSCCEKCEYAIDDSTEHFELQEYYSDLWDDSRGSRFILNKDNGRG